MREIWMMSNRQPWTEGLIRGTVKVKSRSLNVSLTTVGSIVFLHASQALWVDWKYLPWVKNMDVKNLPRGGVYGMGYCVMTGLVWEDEIHKIMFDELYYEPFELYDEGEYWTSCLDEQVIIFDRIQKIPFIPCKGSQTPTKKLPKELKEAIEQNPKWVIEK